MAFPHHPAPLKAVGYALLSQAIWLPLVVIGLHDRWLGHDAAPESTLSGRRGAASPALAQRGPIAGAAGTAATNSGLLSPTSTGLLLGSAGPGGSAIAGSGRPGRGEGGSTADSGATTSGSATSSNLGIFSRTAPLLGAPINTSLLPTRAHSAHQLLLQEFKPSELLGGPLGLNDIQAPAVPALALAERARWADSADPLAPLPSDWREPMRRALSSLPAQPRSTNRLATAKVVHVPSSRIHASTDVPLALQADGSVDILSDPRDPAVLEEIRSWSRRQQAPAAGSVAPAVVRLYPMPQARPSSPAAAVTPAAAPAAAVPEAAAALPQQAAPAQPAAAPAP